MQTFRIFLQSYVIGLGAKIRALDIQAPGDGIVLDLAAIGQKTLITAAQELMRIVPKTPPDRVIAQLPPNKIDQMYRHQPVEILFPGAHSGSDLRLKGKITGISAGTLADLRTGAPYFRAEIMFLKSELDQLDPNTALIPDMPVDVYIKTGVNLRGIIWQSHFWDSFRGHCGKVDFGVFSSLNPG